VSEIWKGMYQRWIIQKVQQNMANQENLATYGTQDKQKQKHNTICVGHHYTQTHTHNVKKT